MPKHIDTIIVGAGLAGLHAARRLRELGQRVVVLEARDRIGGRTWTAPCPGTDIGVDWGAEWIIPALHPQMEALAREFSVSTASEPDDTEWVVPAGRFRGSYEDLKRTRPGFAAGLETLQAWYELADKRELSLTGLLRECVRDAPDRMLLAAAFFPLNGADPEDVSSLAIREEIRFHEGSVDRTLDPAIRRLEQGSGAIVAGLAAGLGDDIRLGWPVQAVSTSAGGVEVTGPAGSAKADRALVAVPVAVLGRIRFTPKLPVAMSLSDAANCGQVTKLWALVTGDAGPPRLQTTHPLRLIYGRRVGGQQLLSAQGLYRDLARADEARLAVLLRSACPGVEVIEVKAHAWTADPWAGGSWMAGRRGSYRPLREAIDAMGGPLKLIGGDVASQWSGWMEGAIHSAADGVRWAASASGDGMLFMTGR